MLLLADYSGGWFTDTKDTKWRKFVTHQVERGVGVANIPCEQVAALRANDVALSQLGEFVGSGAMYGCSMTGAAEAGEIRNRGVIKRGATVSNLYPCGMSALTSENPDGGASVSFVCEQAACHNEGAPIRAVQSLLERIQLIQQLIDRPS